MADERPTSPGGLDPEIEAAMGRAATAIAIRELATRIEDLRVVVAPAIERTARWDGVRAAAGDALIESCRARIGVGPASAELRTVTVVVVLVVVTLAALGWLGVDPITASTEARRWLYDECVPVPAPAPEAP